VINPLEEFLVDKFCSGCGKSNKYLSGCHSYGSSSCRHPGSAAIQLTLRLGLPVTMKTKRKSYFDLKLFS